MDVPSLMLVDWLHQELISVSARPWALGAAARAVVLLPLCPSASSRCTRQGCVQPLPALAGFS